MLEESRKNTILDDFDFSSWRVKRFRGESVTSNINLATQTSNVLKGAKRRRRLANYRRLFEYSCDSFLFVNLKGHILEANLAAIEAYGYSHEELCGLRIHDLRAEKTMDLIERQMQDAYAKGLTFETCHVRKNGEHFQVEVSSHQVAFKQEKILLSIVRDITERKRLEKELVNTESISTIGKVASGLAHEIRNPLTSVHGFLQLVVSQRIDQTKFVENCNLMLQDLDRANSVITELILAANERGMDLKAWNLNQILLTMLPSIQTTARSQEKTVEILLEEIPEILLDQKEIKRLINHLINNGLESMSQGGTIWLRTRIIDDTVILSIKDDGTGIKPEIIDKLGTPFFTTKDTGTGLGLVICKSIVARHKATMTIESNNSGTTVLITFKVSDNLLSQVGSPTTQNER